jgi:hypothetical protein
MVFNRAALDEVTLAIADGLFAIGMDALETANPPDSPYDPYPLGEGLPKQGGVLGYVNGKKVNGFGLDGRQPRAPRAAKVSRSKGAIAIVGWGFPARFNEFGTVKMAAQPFFTPATVAAQGRGLATLKQVAGPKLPKAGR